MPNKLPVSRLIRVTVNLSPTAAQQQNLSTLLVLGTSEVIDVTERIRFYEALDDVTTDFGTSGDEYEAAVLWFGQSPQPTELAIGRWAQTATPGQLVGAIRTAADQALTGMSGWNAIIDGGATVTVDGGAAQVLLNLNFGAVTDMNGVASVINAALTGADIEWRANESRFRIVSDSTGALSTISFLTNNGDTAIAAKLGMLSTSSGAYQAGGLAAETAAAAVAIFDDRFSQQWYAVVVQGTWGSEAARNVDVIAVAAYVEASNTKHFQGVTTQDTAVLSSVDTASLAYQLEALGYNKTAILYSSSNEQAVVSMLARIMTTDYNANSTVIDLMYKQMPGVVAEELSTSQMQALDARNTNVFVSYNNNTDIIEPGDCCSGLPIDEIMGLDWLSTEIQTEGYNVLYLSPTKIPQTDAGANVLNTAYARACQRGVTNGLIAAGTWNSAGFGAIKQGDYLPGGFYIYSQPMADQAQADRETRTAPPVQIAVKLAGAIRTVDVEVRVNR